MKYTATKRPVTVYHDERFDVMMLECDVDTEDARYGNIKRDVMRCFGR